MTPVPFSVYLPKVKETIVAEHSTNHPTSDLSSIAERFTDMRGRGLSVDRYPGRLPLSLAEAYQIQNDAIGRWNQEVRGWKVGRINGDDAGRLGTDRLAGPIFRITYDEVLTQHHEMQVFGAGFAAIEGEVVFIVAEDAPRDKTTWSSEEAQALVGSAHFGVEIASSPFSGINDLGPLVTISDFGNNNGLIVGTEILNWRNFRAADWSCETRIENECVGRGVAADIPGGPLESFRFLLGHTAARGMPLKKGMKISTGAISGVHQVNVGQSATICFGDYDINLTIVDTP